MITSVVLLLVFAGCMQSTLAKWTSYKGDFTFECPSLHHVSRMRSEYNGRNDRRWEYQCSEGFVGEDCEWSDDRVNTESGANFYLCRYNPDSLDPAIRPLITGIKSRYNRGNGRIWMYKCCKLNTKPATDCKTEQYINKWGQPFDKNFGVDRAMFGLTSFFRGDRADRIWTINTCRYVGCQVRRLQVVNPIQAFDEGMQIIGMVVDQTCSNDTSTVQLYRTDAVTRTASLTIANGLEFNWATTLSVGAELTAGFLGSGSTISMGVEHTQGGATTIETAVSDETSTTTENSAGNTLSYQGPGAAIIIGTVNRYRLDTDNIEVDVISTCGDGTEWTKRARMNLRGTTYGMSAFRKRRATFRPEQCGPATEACIVNISGGNDPDMVLRHFENCVGDAGSVNRH